MSELRTCCDCHRVFCSSDSFWDHIVQELHKDTRCMEHDELLAWGFSVVEDCWIAWEEHWSKSWDPERHLWSALYKPGVMFDDLAPKDRPKRPWWRRLWSMWYNADM